MSQQVPVKGLDEVLAVLSAFPDKLKNQAIRQGLTAAAAVVRDEARLRAPNVSGKLAHSIKSGSPRKIGDGIYSISIRLDGRGNNHAFLGLFFEYGVSPHYITAGDSDLKARKLTQKVRKEGSSDVAEQALKINGQFVTGAILHPGFAARPFLRPSLDIKSGEALQAFATRVRAVVENLTGFAPVDMAA